MNVHRQQGLKKGTESFRQRETISEIQPRYNKLYTQVLMIYTFLRASNLTVVCCFKKLPALFKILLIFGIVNSSTSGRD